MQQSHFSWVLEYPQWLKNFQSETHAFENVRLYFFFLRKTTDWRSNRALQISVVALCKFQFRAVLLNLSISVSYQSFYPIGLER